MSSNPNADAVKTPDSIPVLERKEISVEDLLPNPLNPNMMSDRQFSLLVGNIRATGFTDPVFVRPLGEGKYEIIGGHHRWQAAKVLGMETVPCTVNTDPEFDADQANFQMMRHNMVKGRLSTEKFLKLYEDMSTKYTREQLSEAFGFEEQQALDKLVAQTAKGLPKELKAKFKEAQDEIKTVDDLAKVLNRLFATYGDTLKYGYMYFDFGGKDSIWVRMLPADRKLVEALAYRCVDHGRSLDSAFRVALQLIAEHRVPDFETELLKTAPVQVQVGLPVEDNAQ